MIVLNEEYTIDVTANSYNLMVKKGLNKDGSVRWSAIGYYATMYQAVAACVENMTKRRLMEGEYDLSGALDVIREQKDILNEMLRKEGLFDGKGTD
jgi:hypothetical protein